MKYSKPIKDNKKGFVYSVDKCRISFYENPCFASEITAWFSSISRTDIVMYPQNMTFARFRYMLTVNYGDDTATIGFSFNGSDPKNDAYKGFIEFNPNKVADSPQFLADFRELKSCCRIWECSRIDLAVDVPIPREYVYLAKDQRKYSCDVYSSENLTEYLGLRNNVGRVKVYNKALEQKLSSPLTRVEVTCEPTLRSFSDHFPMVYDFSQGMQLDMAAMDSLSDTDKYILAAESVLISNRLDPGLVRFRSLGRKKREKLEQYLLPEFSVLSYNSNCVNEVLSNFIDDYIK